MSKTVASQESQIVPAAEEVVAGWSARVRADREQVDRSREINDPADFYAPVASRFSFDPRRTGDQTLDVLVGLVDPTDVWLDIGSGGGRFALPIALACRAVICVDPSGSMLDVLREGAAEYDVQNLRIIRSRWPLAADLPDVEADASLMAHVGYDIEEIGPFLDAAERSTRRICVAVMGEGAMTTAATMFWADVHGEPRVRLPALRELLTLLLARGRLPQVTLVEREPPAFDSFDDLLFMARRQLWVRPGSPKDSRLVPLVRDAAMERGGRWTIDARPTSIGICSWSPA